MLQYSGAFTEGVDEARRYC